MQLLHFPSMLYRMPRSQYPIVQTTLFVSVWAIALGSSVAMAADLSHEMGKIKTDGLREISGVAASRLNPDVLWLHNDGPAKQLFAISTTGKLVAILNHGLDLIDFEDVAIGPGPKSGVDYLYLGDIGDNESRRREIRVMRFPEPKLAGERGQELSANNSETFRLVYPDHPHDAETLIVDPATGDLLIVTKEKHGARLYGVASDSLKHLDLATLTKMGSLKVDEISAGAISDDGRRLLLRRENQGWLWQRGPQESLEDVLTKKPQKVAVLGKRQGPNGESITFGPTGDYYFTVSEGKKQAIYRFDLPPTATDPSR